MKPKAKAPKNPDLSVEQYHRIYKVIFKQGWSTDSRMDEAICNILRGFLAKNGINADAKA